MLDFQPGSEADAASEPAPASLFAEAAGLGLAALLPLPALEQPANITDRMSMTDNKAVAVFFIVFPPD
ncbi:hypothetical protein D3C78_1889130 [compost metagenome]